MRDSGCDKPNDERGVRLWEGMLVTAVDIEVTSEWIKAGREGMCPFERISNSTGMGVYCYALDSEGPLAGIISVGRGFGEQGVRTGYSRFLKTY